MPAREQVLDVPGALAMTNKDQFAGHVRLRERGAMLTASRVGIESALAPGAPFAQGLVQDRTISRQGGARGRWVMQVHGDAAEQQRLSVDSGILQPRAQLLVFGSPALDGLVETVHTHKVGAPEGLVAALDGDETIGQTVCG